MQLLGSLAAVFLAGFLYFISAIPAGIALKLPIWLVAFAAWLGYSAGAVVVGFAGEPLRDWMMKKLRIDPHTENPNFIQRLWKKHGLVAVGLLAPVTIGPQGSALLGLALGESKWRLIAAISLGAVPWTIAFAALAAFGIRIGK